jgi:hypothetical protein
MFTSGAMVQLFVLARDMPADVWSSSPAGTGLLP